MLVYPEIIEWPSGAPLPQIFLPNAPGYVPFICAVPVLKIEIWSFQVCC